MTTVFAGFVKGLICGFTMAAIPGPIFFLIVQRTLAEGALIGLLCGLGAVSADTLYALTAAVGLSYVTQFLLEHQSWLALAGGLLLLYLGITTYRRTVRFHAIKVKDTRLFMAWFSTFLLTLANPVTILSYTLIFAGLGLDSQHQDRTVLFALVGGVTVGATSVALLLVSTLRYFRQRFSPAMLNIVNKIAALVLIGFGVAALLRGLFQVNLG